MPPTRKHAMTVGHKRLRKRRAAATTIQRKYRAGRTAHKKKWALTKVNAEKKFLTLPEQTATLQVLAGSAANGPANSILLFPQCFDRNSQLLGQGLTSSNCIGSWITPIYGINHKIELTFNDLAPNHADSQQGFNIYMWKLLVKVSGNKADLTTNSFADWAASVSAMCKRELFEANFDADFLEYSQRNKNIQVLSKWRVNTSQDKKYAIGGIDATNLATRAPPKRYTVTHYIPKPNQKQRVTVGAAGVSEGILNDTWVPAVMYTCSELSANTGTVAIRHGSRFYFTDT
jgi:hypothetical protein